MPGGVDERPLPDSAETLSIGGASRHSVHEQDTGRPRLLNERTEGKAAATFDDLGRTVQVHQTVNDIDLALIVLMLHRHVGS